MFSLCIYHISAQDSLPIKRHTIYIVPSGFILTDGVINALWLPLGYDYQLNKKQFIGIGVGVIITYEKAAEYDLLWEYPAEKIIGYSMNIEHKLILRKRLYYSTNLLYRKTKFYEKEILSNGKEHTYFIINDIGAINAKIGFFSFSRQHIFTDFGIGIGIKYISGKTIDRLMQPGILLVDNQGNRFGDENVFKPNFILQFKVGYNF